MLTIRAAELRDCVGLARVHVDSWRVTYRGYMPDSVLDALDYDERTARWQRNLSHPQAQTYVALDAGEQVVGFAGCGNPRDADLDDRWAELYALYVAPACVRQGIGAALLKHVQNEARQTHSAMALWVGDKNPNAVAFYEAQGFALDGLTKTEYAEDGTALGHLRMTCASS